MITITRSMAQHVRAVCRRADIGRRGRVPPLAFCAGPAGVRIVARSMDIIVSYLEPGNSPVEQFAVPFGVLSACEGARTEPVTLEQLPDSKIRAAWNDRGVPRSVDYDVPQNEREVVLPAEPTTWQECPPALLGALQEANDTTDDQSLRYALGCVQLRGDTGEIAATDTRQLFVQSGFHFPWTDNVLVYGVKVFRSREFAECRPLRIGKTETHVVIQLGPWQVFLRIEKEKRFPKIEQIIPNADTARTRLMLDPSDAEFLASTLSRLPHGEDNDPAVTLNCNGRIVVSARPAGQSQGTALVLSRSGHSGEQVALRTDRKFLKRAVRLGFRDVYLQGSASPLFCDDTNRKYIWQPFEGKPSPTELEAECFEIDSATVVPSQPGTPVTPAATITLTNGVKGTDHAAPLTNRRNRMSRNRLNGHSNGHAGQEGSTTLQNGNAPASSVQESNQTEGFNDPIREAECLKDVLRSALARTSRLVKSLRRQKKQARLVQTTLASLRELGGVS